MTNSLPPGRYVTDTVDNLFFIRHVCIVCYRLAGMPLFDAICHGISTVSLGVISTHSERVSDILITIWLSWWLVLFPCYRIFNTLIVISRKTIKPLIRDIELRFFR